MMSLVVAIQLILVFIVLLLDAGKINIIVIGFYQMFVDCFEVENEKRILSILSVTKDKIFK